VSIAQGVRPPSPAPPPPAPSGRDVLIGLSLSGALFLVLAVGAGFLHLAHPGEWHYGPWGLLIQLALANAVLAIAALVVAARRGWGVFRFKPLSRRSLAFCAAGGAAGGISLALLLTTLSEATGWPLHGVNDELMGVNELPSVGLAIFAIVAAGTTPLVEELIFRGLLFQWLRGWMGPIGAALVSSVFFGALHLPSGQAVWAGLVGFALALLYHRLGSLWAAVAAHAGNNALAIVLVLTLAI
jgi:membrane protease YdiL (CAAX protease family)